MSDVHSVGGYTFAASLFLFGLTGWQVLLAMAVGILAVYVLMNMVGRPSLEHGIPFPVMARVSMGVMGANLAALIRGVAQGSGVDQEAMTSFYREDIGAIPEMDLVAKQVWEISGLSPGDVDAAIIYDAFTAIVLWQLESFGFCKPGEAQEFVAAGGIARGGRLPTNTNGGQLSEAYIHGMNGVNEGVRLVRGESANQPENTVEHVLVTSGVGVPTSAMVLGRMS